MANFTQPKKRRARYKPVSIRCSVCNEIFITRSSRSKYCSKKCAQRAFRKNNPEKLKLYWATRDLKPIRKFQDYRRCAKRRGQVFDISYEFFLTMWQVSCWYCGDKIKTIGIDRLDSSQGYTPLNVVPCCKWCNRMKLNYHYMAFLKQCSKVLKNNQFDRDWS